MHCNATHYSCQGRASSNINLEAAVDQVEFIWATSRTWTCPLPLPQGEGITATAIDVSINHDKPTVIPAKAADNSAFALADSGLSNFVGIQQDKNAFCLNPLDSRRSLPSNAVVGGGNDVVILYIPQLILKGEELSSIMESSINNINLASYIILRGLRGARQNKKSYSPLGSSLSKYPTKRICHGITANDLPLAMARAMRRAASSGDNIKGIG